MPGAPISRWTMSYFAASIAFLLLGLGLMAGGVGFPAGDLGAPDSLVVVHVIAIGWLGFLFCGALLQFVPVLSGAAPRWQWLSAPAFVFILCGLIGLVTGFLSLGGRMDVTPAAMFIGALLLATGLGALAVTFAATILSQTSIDLPGRLVLLGALGLVATVLLGSVFAGVLSGMLEADWAAALLAVGLPVHAASGLLGWMTLTALGVSYRLFSMFMLAPEKGLSSRSLTAGAALGLAALYGGLAVASGFPSLQTAARLGAVMIAAVTAALYIADMVKMFLGRRRKALELNMTAGLAALGFLPAGLVLVAVGQLADGESSLAEAGYYILAMGWLSGLGLAQLYKIVPFLTWMETYGPVMGRSPVPRVQDLVNESQAGAWFIIYHCAVVAGMICLLLDFPAAFRAAALGQFVAVLGLAVEYVRARRLFYAPEPVRLPAGSVRPHLMYANAN